MLKKNLLLYGHAKGIVLFLSNGSLDVFKKGNIESWIEYRIQNTEYSTIQNTKSMKKEYVVSTYVDK